MTAIGGSISEVSLEGRVFSVAADADTQRKLGGFENEIQMNGDGTSRTIKTRVGWMVSGLTLSIDDSRLDHEFLQELSDRNSDFAISVTYASGVIYSGKGQITGELQTGSQNQTGSLTLGGGGKLVAQ